MTEQIQLETTLFGTLEFAGGNGLMEDYTITIGEREIQTTLYIWEELVTQQNQEAVQALLEEIPTLYDKARKEIERSYQTNAVMRLFIQSQIEEMEEEVLLDYFQVEELAQITPERFIEKLEPRTICIAPIEEGESPIDCTFDFSIDKERSDELLVLSFNQSMELYRIAHES